MNNSKKTPRTAAHKAMAQQYGFTNPTWGFCEELESDLSLASAKLEQMENALRENSSRLAFMYGAFGHGLSMTDKNLNRDALKAARAALASSLNTEKKP